MIIKLTVDRIEGGVAVCFDDFEKKYECTAPVAEGDVFEAEMSDEGEITFIRILKEETLGKTENNSLRLKALFRRGGNKR